jgi:hypothetical protein
MLEATVAEPGDGERWASQSMPSTPPVIDKSIPVG